MRILVTGVSGFVGGAVASRLKREGIEVHGLSRSTPSLDYVDRHFSHDLRKPLLTSLQYDWVIHCAALCSPWADPKNYYQSNVIGTENILKCCVNSGLPKFLFISSSSVHYENQDQFEIHEETPWPTEPINEYARSKRRCEALVRDYPGSWTIFRPRAVYGEGDRSLMPKILQAAKAGGLPQLIRKDGKPVHGDLIYIENLTYFILQAIRKQSTGTYILTNNESVIISDLLQDVLAELNYPKMKWRISVDSAMKFAKAAEWLSSSFLNFREPAITQFGVSVFAYSKTFDVRKSISDLGTPPFSTQEGMDRFLRSWRACED